MAEAEPLCLQGEDLLLSLRRQYNSMAAPHMLLFKAHPDRFPWTWPCLQAALTNITEAPFNSAHPPSANYKKTFLKTLISILEKRGIEVEDQMYEAYSKSVTSSSEESVYKTYDIGNGNGARDVFLTLQERKEFVSQGTTGLVTWQAGLAMIEWLQTTPAAAVMITGKRVLELGSGVGLLGMALGRLLRPAALVLSDCHATVLDTLQDNLALNGFADSARAVHLDWDHAQPDFLLDTLAPDVVVAADIIYDTALFDGLVQVLYTLLHRRACRALLACTVRNPATLAAFVGRLDAMYLAVDVTPLRLGPLFVYEPYTEVQLLSVVHNDIGAD